MIIFENKTRKIQIAQYLKTQSPRFYCLISSVEKFDSFLIGYFILILSTDWMANKHLSVNVNQSFLETVANKVILKEIPRSASISVHLTELTI